MLNPQKLWVKGFRPYRKTTITFARRVKTHFHVRLTSGDTIQGQPGDYACISPADGDRWIVAQGIFKQIYAPADVENVHANKFESRLYQRGFRPYRKHQITWARRISKPHLVRTLEGDVMAQAGDYLCIGSKGELWPQQAARFEAHYEPVRPRRAAGR